MIRWHKSIILIIVTYFYGAMLLHAQDIPFSQYSVNPVYFNPATVGDVEKDFRVTTNYKNQWRSLTDVYKSRAITYDMPFYQDFHDKKYLGIALSYFNDVAGSTNLKLNLYSLSLAYNTKIDRYNSISMGISGNYGRRSIDLSEVKWENQHNGNNYDPSLPSGETINSDHFGYWDLGAGIRWKDEHSYDGYRSNVGLAVYHINQPQQSFLKSNSERLKRKYQLHGEVEILSETYTVSPQLLIIKQLNIYSFTAGAMVKLKPDELAESKYTDFNVVSYLSFGAFYRYKDAAIFAMRYDYKRTLAIGLSYDITVSKIRKNNQGNGGMEISLVYNGAFSNSKIKVKNKGVKEKDKINMRKDNRNL